MTRRVTVRGIIYNNGKLFAQKLKKGDGERDYWCTPGGGLDDGESLHDGLRREMIEETGVAPVIGKLLYIQQYKEADSDKEYLEFFFHITNAADYETIDLASTSHGELEVSQYGFIDTRTEYILPEFLQSTDIANAINSTEPVEVSSYL